MPYPCKKRGKKPRLENSLNASVAAGVMMYAIMNARGR